MYEEALKIITAFVAVGLITSCVVGNALILLPYLLAAWAVWQVAEGISGK